MGTAIERGQTGHVVQRVEREDGALQGLDAVRRERSRGVVPELGDDGRLGLIDFGFMLELDETAWNHFREIDRPQTTGRREDRLAAMRSFNRIGDGPREEDRLRLTAELCDWFWRCRYCGGEFDFGDEADFRRGVDLMVEMSRKRYTCGEAYQLTIAKQTFGIRSILYRLKAKIDVKPLAEADIGMTGWDRSEYAGVQHD